MVAIKSSFCLWDSPVCVCVLKLIAASGCVSTVLPHKHFVFQTKTTKQEWWQIFMAYRQKRIIARKPHANQKRGREPWSNVKIFLNTICETVKWCKCSINADELW